jgi:hypothetical protein
VCAHLVIEKVRGSTILLLRGSGAFPDPKQSSNRTISIKDER